MNIFIWHNHSIFKFFIHFFLGNSILSTQILFYTSISNFNFNFVYVFENTIITWFVIIFSICFGKGWRRYLQNVLVSNKFRSNSLSISIISNESSRRHHSAFHRSFAHVHHPWKIIFGLNFLWVEFYLNQILINILLFICLIINPVPFKVLPSEKHRRSECLCWFCCGSLYYLYYSVRLVQSIQTRVAVFKFEWENVSVIIN